MSNRFFIVIMVTAKIVTKAVITATNAITMRGKFSIGVESS